MREEAEDSNLDKVAGHLRGKPKLLAFVLYLLDSGKLQAQLAKQAPQEPSVANSTNKWNQLTVNNWSEILACIDPVRFPKAKCQKLRVLELCKLGCFIAGVEP
eukprot:566315-Amphidinium_carterae.1